MPGIPCVDEIWGNYEQLRMMLPQSSTLLRAKEFEETFGFAHLTKYRFRVQNMGAESFDVTIDEKDILVSAILRKLRRRRERYDRRNPRRPPGVGGEAPVVEDDSDDETGIDARLFRYHASPDAEALCRRSNANPQQAVLRKHVFKKKGVNWTWFRKFKTSRAKPDANCRLPKCGEDDAVSKKDQDALDETILDDCHAVPEIPAYLAKRALAIVLNAQIKAEYLQARGLKSIPSWEQAEVTFDGPQYVAAPFTRRRKCTNCHNSSKLQVFREKSQIGHV